MIGEKKKLNDGDWNTILFHPEKLHVDFIEKLKGLAGQEIISHFQDAYNVLQLALSIGTKWPEHKKRALVPLADGFSSLVCVINLSNLGFAVEPCLILRYYLEAMGLSYGIFHDQSLYEKWKNNPDKEYANRFTKEGINMLSKKDPHFKDMWKTYSEISHFAYSATGSSRLTSDSIAVSGVHSDGRDKWIEQNIKAAEILIAVTGEMIKKEYLTENSSDVK